MSTKKLQFGLASAGNLWTPQNDSAELKGWWRGDIASTIIQNGQDVTSWNNLIDNTLWSMQSDSGAATPETGTTSVNGINVITFDNPERLVCSKGTAPENDGNFTFIALLDSPSVNQSDDSIFTIEDNPGNRIGIAANNTSTFMGATKVGGDLSNTQFDFTGGPYTGTNIFVLDMDFLTNTIRARVNGTEVGTNSNYVNKFGNKILCRFMSNAGGNRQLAGNLGDFIIAKFAQGYQGTDETPGSSPFIQQTEGYLAWRYGMESKLAFNHPYRDAPPRDGEPISPSLFDPPPTSSNSSITTNELQSYTFSASDFPYSDAGGQPMAHVSIESLPDSLFLMSTFELNGVAVTLGQNINTADIPNLVWTPTSLAFGAPYDTFNFSVNDGNQDSSLYTMSLNVNAGGGGG